MYGRYRRMTDCLRLESMKQKVVSGFVWIWYVLYFQLPSGYFEIIINAQSADGRFTASGHENGSIYVFNNDTGRLSHSLAGLVQPVRSVSFSPASKLLAAAGDAKIIALYDINSGEQVANFTGHGGWILSLDWSDTGEYLLSR